MLEYAIEVSSVTTSRPFERPSFVGEQQYSATDLEVLGECRRWKRILSGTLREELAAHRVARETMENYSRYVNKGLVANRKSATENVILPALEWTGQGSILTDNLGREYIDCLGGYGLYSLGMRHPVVVRAVESQLHRR